MSRDTVSVAHLKETSLFKWCKRLAQTVLWSMYGSPVIVTFQYTWEIIEWDEYFKTPIEKTKVKIYLEKWPCTCFIYCNFIFAFVTSSGFKNTICDRKFSLRSSVLSGVCFNLERARRSTLLRKRISNLLYRWMTNVMHIDIISHVHIWHVFRQSYFLY